MTIAVKICGLTSLAAVDAAADAGAAYGGLVFHRRSPRFVAIPAARELAARMAGRLKTVALVADMDDDELAAIVEAIHPDLPSLTLQTFERPTMPVLSSR